MSETLGEIQERLRPDHLIQQAKDTVTEAATGKVRNIMHSAGETATMVADQTKYAGRNRGGLRPHAPGADGAAGRRRHVVAAARPRSVGRVGRRVGRLAGHGHRAPTTAITAYGEDRSLPTRSASTPRRRAKRWASTPRSARETVERVPRKRRARRAPEGVRARQQRARRPRRCARRKTWQTRQHLGGQLGARISARGRRHCGGRRRRDRPVGAEHRDSRTARWARSATRRIERARVAARDRSKRT